MHTSRPRPARRSVVLALALALVVSGCQSRPPIQGKLVDDVYTAPHGNYSMPLPFDTDWDRKMGGRRIQDGARDVQGKEGYVSVSTDWGELRSVEYAAIPAAGRANFEGAALPDTLARFYREALVAEKAKNFPGMRSLHDEALSDAFGPAHFGVVFIPKGSTLTSSNALGLPSGERHDTVRSFLVFAKNGYLYDVGCATKEDAVQADTTLTPERLEAYRGILRGLRDSMRFAPPR